MSRECVISTLVCPECGMEIPIPRNHGRQREKGHIKDIYCPKCREVKQCKEIKYSEFYRNLDGEIVYSEKKKAESTEPEDKYDLNKDDMKID